MDDPPAEEPVDESPKSKRVFLSYAWEDENYKLWVKRLATRLRGDGVEARLDAWHLKGNDNVADFMNREVRHADWVLVICSPGYRKKVRATEDGERVAGVGWETRLLSSGVLIDNENKVLAVLGRGEWKDVAPDGIRGQNRYDLSDEAAFETNYRLLLQEITGTSEQAPPLGKLPADLEANPPAPLRGADVPGAASHPPRLSTVSSSSGINVVSPSTMPVERRPSSQVWWGVVLLAGLAIAAGSLLAPRIIHRQNTSAVPAPVSTPGNGNTVAPSPSSQPPATTRESERQTAAPAGPAEVPPPSTRRSSTGRPERSDAPVARAPDAAAVNAAGQPAAGNNPLFRIRIVYGSGGPSLPARPGVVLAGFKCQDGPTETIHAPNGAAVPLGTVDCSGPTGNRTKGLLEIESGDSDLILRVWAGFDEPGETIRVAERLEQRRKGRYQIVLR